MDRQPPCISLRTKHVLSYQKVDNPQPVDFLVHCHPNVGWNRKKLISLDLRITSSLFNCLRPSPWPSNAHYHFEFAATRPGKHAEAMMTSEEIHFAVILLAGKLHVALFINGPMMPNVILFMELFLLRLPVCLMSHRLCHEVMKQIHSAKASRKKQVMP